MQTTQAENKNTNVVACAMKSRTFLKNSTKFSINKNNNSYQICTDRQRKIYRYYLSEHEIKK